MFTKTMSRGYKLKNQYVGTLSDEAKAQINKWRDWKEPVTRNDVHSQFILEAYLASLRSLDAQTQCGCVLVKNNTIIGTGYNSFVRGINDDILPNLRDEKYPFMIHSEHNAILNCARNGISCLNAIAYITGPPCCNCLQFMYQAGIKQIYYPNYNHANMCANKEHDIKYEILKDLIPIDIYLMELEEDMIEKIEKIKSLRA